MYSFVLQGIVSELCEWKRQFDLIAGEEKTMSEIKIFELWGALIFSLF